MDLQNQFEFFASYVLVLPVSATGLWKRLDLAEAHSWRLLGTTTREPLNKISSSIVNSDSTAEYSRNYFKIFERLSSCSVSLRREWNGSGGEKEI